MARRAEARHHFSRSPAGLITTDCSMRRFPAVLLLPFLFWLSGAPAHAQVAVPSLVPSAPRIGDPVFDVPTVSFVTPNPAAMQWGSPSKWGGGQIRSERQQTLPAPPSPIDEFSGLYIGFRKVEKTITFAAELLELSDDTNVPRTADWDVLDGAVAFQSGDSIAFGVGMDRTSTTTGTGNSLEFNTISLGMSIEVQSNVFIGFAIGTEDISSTFNGDDDRSVQKYGVAYRKGGAINTHFELYAVERDEADNFANEFTDVSTIVGVAEFNISNLLLAASISQTERDRIGIESATVTFDLGWAPKNGLAVMFHQEQTTTEDVNAVVTTEFETDTTAISIAFQF
jgi:hypothetical protein